MSLDTKKVQPNQNTAIVSGNIKSNRLIFWRLWSKKAKIIAVITIVLFIVLALIWIIVINKPNKPVNEKIADPFKYQTANELAQKPIPKDLDASIIYYSRIGGDFMIAKQYDSALRAYLKAQEIVDNNEVYKKDYRYYLNIGDIYEKSGNKKEAIKYYQKELEYAQSNIDKEGMRSIIEITQRKIDNLK